MEEVDLDIWGSYSSILLFRKFVTTEAEDATL